MARKKKAPEGGGGAPAWLATYGDMVTLVLCFFVLLYSFSTLDVVKFQSLANSLSSALNFTPAADMVVEGQGQAGGKATETANSTRIPQKQNSYEADRVLARVEEIIQQNSMQKDVTVTVTERGVVISLSEQLLFPSGSAEIQPEAARMLYKIGGVLMEFRSQIAVEGHSDAEQPAPGSIYRDNWALSSARAAAVTSYLNFKVGIREDNLQAVGFGSRQPLVPNDTTEHQALNRRVDLVLLSDYNAQ